MSRAQMMSALLALCLLAGCAAAPGGSSAQSPAAPGESSAQEPPAVSPVYTDWSKLTPYQPAEPLYTYFEPFQGATLTARPDYGPLLPYVGATITMSDYIIDTLPLYGLVTCDGQVVTDPEYAEIYTRSYAERQDAAQFLILLKGGPDSGGRGMFSQAGSFQLTVAAPDGSWVREFGVASAEPADEGHLAVTGTDNAVTVIDEAGETTAYFPAASLTPYLGEDFQFEMEKCTLSWYNGVGGAFEWARAEEDAAYQFTCYLDSRDGSVSDQPPPDFSTAWTGSVKGLELAEYSYLTPIPDPVTGEMYFCGRPIDSADDLVMDVLSREGEKLLTVQISDYFYYPIIRAGLCASIENDAFCYYDFSGDCVFRYPLRSNAE